MDNEKIAWSALDLVLDSLGAYTTLMALSTHEGGAAASRKGGVRLTSLAAIVPPARHAAGPWDFDGGLTLLSDLGFIWHGRPRALGFLARRPEVGLTEAGRAAADALWRRASGELAGLVEFAGEDDRRVRMLAVLRFARMDSAELQFRIGLGREETWTVASDLASEGLMFTIGTFIDGDFLRMGEVGLTGDGFVVGRAVHGSVSLSPWESSGHSRSRPGQ